MGNPYELPCSRCLRMSSDGASGAPGGAGGAIAAEADPPETNASLDASDQEGAGAGSAHGGEAGAGDDSAVDEKSERLRLTAEKLKLQVRCPRRRRPVGVLG